MNEKIKWALVGAIGLPIAIGAGKTTFAGLQVLGGFLAIIGIIIGGIMLAARWPR